ncbi:hypothetical protein [Kitasatospora sp. NPDC001527]|uniref:hypothetical protein n=1 Tax=Kitasatospora sp. NPDC001527 TaxID=3154519 RepID=UPI00332C28B3
MTNVITLPAPTDPPTDPPTGDEDRARQHAVNGPLAEAGEAGRRAAGRPGGPVGARPRRAADRGDAPDSAGAEAHRTVLGRAAGAVAQARGREVVPGGEGQPDGELAYDLGAGSSPAVRSPPDCPSRRSVSGSRWRRCAPAAAMPRTVRGDLEREPAVPAATTDAAAQAGRSSAHGPPVQRPLP